MATRPGTLLVVAGLLTGAALAQSVGSPARPGALALPTPSATSSRPTPVQATATTSRHRSGQPKGAGGKVIYLTFDDGPQPIWTPKVLRILDRHDARATFFLLGREVVAYPELATEIRRRGHTIGNHTYDHKMLTLLSPDKIRWQLRNGPRSRCFRPPFRETNRQIHAIAAALGMREILWDVDTEDWRKPGVAAIERAILTGARPGAIVLLHDGGHPRWQTTKALDRVLTKLTARGYRFRALSC